jgi:hypothetical protein
VTFESVPQPIAYFCSTGWTTSNGYNLRTINETLKISIFPDAPYEEYLNGQRSMEQLAALRPLCEIVDPALLNELRTTKVLNVRNLGTHCANLTPGTYRVAVVKASETMNYTHNLLMDMNIRYQGIPLNVATPEQMFQYSVGARMKAEITQTGPNAKKFQIIPYANGIHGNAATILNGTFGLPGCDNSASPLAVQMKSNVPLALTSRAEGIQFDILGKNATPVPHAKRQISWLTPESAAGNFFIVLPSERGEVNGIEEMFGNNTSGPDGKFARDGYEALRKFDGRILGTSQFDIEAVDNRITRKDQIFAKLRLWRDSNTDGLAQNGELFTLDEMQVRSIDLAADPTFAEKDIHGNTVALKSVLQTNDGKLHLVYDIWFALD